MDRHPLFPPSRALVPGEGALPWPDERAESGHLGAGRGGRGEGGPSLAETLMRELPVSTLCLVSSKCRMVLGCHSPLFAATDIPHGEQMRGWGGAIDKELSRCSQRSAWPQEGKTDPPEAPNGVPGYAALLASPFLFLLPHTQLSCP